MLKNKLITILKSEIFLVVLLALVIRSFFINLNYPFVFHPDEPTVVNSTINLRYNSNPGHFDWPTFYYYFTYPFFYIFEKVYFLLNDLGLIKSISIDKIYYYIVSRSISVLFGSFTCLIIYKILLNLKISKEYSLLGACIMALIPFHVTRSALALTDIPMVFFTTLSILFLSKNLDTFKDSNFIWACFFAGLSVSTKYNGYMIFLTLGLYIIYIKYLAIKDLSLYIKSALASILGFFVGTPYFIFDYKTFFISDSPKGALWQFQNVGKVNIDEQFINFIQNLLIDSYALMGYVPLILSLLFIIHFFISKSFLKKDIKSKFILIMIIQFIFIFWSVSGVEMQRSHYLMMVYIYLPLFSILLLSQFSEIKYLKEISFSLFVILSIFVLYNRIDFNPVAKLYERINVSGNKKEIVLGFNNSDTEKLADTLRVSKVKINLKNSKSLEKVTHIASTSEVCLSNSDCKFKLVVKIDSRNNLDPVYFYEKK